MQTNAPVPFEGTPDEAEANYQTHRWTTYQFGEDDFETECDVCIARPYHADSRYPCGQPAPRRLIPADQAVREQMVRFIPYAVGGPS